MKQWIAALLLMLIPGVQAAKPQKSDADGG
ncbi:outer membrane porin HofQ [Escherichia coli]|uniref:Outer membrane porin HofQ n=1 Tax=Escherichia coli TaxID=562 RepID=A0A377JYN2_ECOLX|nr:outer membrane porin HofQ [Escherichia coli]